MRAVAGVLVLIGAAAQAQPSDELEACKARRRELTAQAMQIDDAARRGEALAAMPICRRNADGSTQVDVPQPAPVDDAPFSPRFHFAVRTGVTANMVMAAQDFEPDGAGPYLELEAGYRWERAWSASAFGSYTRFSGEVPATQVGFLTVYDSLYDAGVRIARHHFRWWVGGGLGYERDNNVAYEGMKTAHELGLVEENIGYRLALASACASDYCFLSTLHSPVWIWPVWPILVSNMPETREPWIVPRKLVST